ncbi:short chain dehydrogenase [Kluyvera cryocrescens]|uniref:Short chain dehydrogenase n=1 Tax=Kluyvera cryocrescens TaxID=580 RepID=A0A485BGQ2_KLUCR|nr:short chain dehydrogenase [Kluyvera cryocrescens]
MQSKTLLLIGASRGLGHAMAETFVQRGWKVIGAVRDSAQHTPLHALAGRISAAGPH